MKKRALFLVLHRRDRSPGQRYRHEQYITYLEANGFECVFSPLLNKQQDKLFYSSGNYFQKVVIGLRSLAKRWKDARSAKSFDLVYVYRDAFFFGTFIERKIYKSSTPIIYDFDDAIWLQDENPNQGLFNKLKTPDKVPQLISLASTVIVGSQYLANYASTFNKNVTLIPSTVDLVTYQLIPKEETDTVCIGWTGSFSTLKHFEWIIPALEEIKSRFGDKVKFKLIGVPNYYNEALTLQGTEWKSKSEVEDLGELDIGIMPLPDNEWTRGKCAMKGIQYMALGIATVMSPVGVNSDIITDGKNGLLAATMDEWIEKLSLLIQDHTLRKTLGDHGRITVTSDFSTKANEDKWLKAFHLH